MRQGWISHWNCYFKLQCTTSKRTFCGVGGEGREQSYLNFSVYPGVKFAPSNCTIHEEMANFLIVKKNSTIQLFYSSDTSDLDLSWDTKGHTI